MLAVEAIDPRSRAGVSRFLRLPHALYRGEARWVPPLDRDAALVFDRRRHPFYDHSDAVFFLALHERRVVGRVAALDHRPYNDTHGVRYAFFSLFESEDDPEVAAALFNAVSAWARGRGLTDLVGPRGVGPLDGYGLLVDGFDHRQLMTMTGYNPPSYPRLVEGLGFRKEVDFVSYRLSRRTFVLPEAVRAAAERAARTFRVVRHPSMAALVRAACRIGGTYNRAFAGNWEFYPLSDREVNFVIDQVRPLADHRLITFIAAADETVGFVLAFADVSRALQTMGGRLTPWGVARLLLERRRATTVALNGAGVLPEFQGRGVNALLYAQIEHAVRQARFDEAELPQVAETATRMRRDLERLGAVACKTHRVYRLAL